MTARTTDTTRTVGTRVSDRLAAANRRLSKRRIGSVHKSRTADVARVTVRLHRMAHRALLVLVKMSVVSVAERRRVGRVVPAAAHTSLVIVTVVTLELRRVIPRVGRLRALVVAAGRRTRAVLVPFSPPP
jgi:hypothetical protein